MKKFKAFLIVAGILILAALIGLCFWLGPGIINLFKPWFELIAPYGKQIWFVVFCLFAVWLSFRKWKWWFKTIVFMLGLSAISLITKTDLGVMLISTPYVIASVAFTVVSAIIIVWQHIPEDEVKPLVEATTLKECGDFAKKVKGCSGQFIDKGGAITKVPNKVFLQKIGRNICLSFHLDGWKIDGEDKNNSYSPKPFILNLGEFGEMLISVAEVFEKDTGNGIDIVVNFQV